MNLVNTQNIIIQRQSNQQLAGSSFNTTLELITHLGAMQSQEFLSARWGIGVRLKNLKARDVEHSYNEGKIIRTHTMRPTWHFIPPQDLIWMQELTSPRVRQLMSHYNKKLELTDDLFKKTNSLLIKLLKGKNYLTRAEIKKELEKIQIKTDVQRLAHIMMWPELDGIICSGPLRGKQFTYALSEERIPNFINFSRNKGLKELATRYFRSHGPATIKDFSWWSGLSMEDSRNAVEMLGQEFGDFKIDNVTYLFPKNSNIQKNSVPYAYLLSIFDEYTIAYKDRSALGADNFVEQFIRMGNALTAVIVLDGKIIGTWKRKLEKDSVNVVLNYLKKIDSNQKNAVHESAHRYANFLEMKLVVSELSSE